MENLKNLSSMQLMQAMELMTIRVKELPATMSRYAYQIMFNELAAELESRQVVNNWKK